MMIKNEKVVDLEDIRVGRKLKEMINKMTPEEFENFKSSALMGMLVEIWEDDIIEEAKREVVYINIEKYEDCIGVEANNICSALYYDDVEEDYKSLSFEEILRAFVLFVIENTQRLLTKGVKFVRINNKYSVDLIKEEVTTYPDRYFKGKEVKF